MCFTNCSRKKQDQIWESFKYILNYFVLQEYIYWTICVNQSINKYNHFTFLAYCKLFDPFIMTSLEQNYFIVLLFTTHKWKCSEIYIPPQGDSLVVSEQDCETHCMDEGLVFATVIRVHLEHCVGHYLSGPIVCDRSCTCVQQIQSMCLTCPRQVT